MVQQQVALWQQQQLHQVASFTQSRRATGLECFLEPGVTSKVSWRGTCVDSRALQQTAVWCSAEHTIFVWALVLLDAVQYIHQLPYPAKCPAAICMEVVNAVCAFFTCMQTASRHLGCMWQLL
jgi:hypothetical protein